MDNTFLAQGQEVYVIADVSTFNSTTGKETTIYNDMGTYIVEHHDQSGLYVSSKELPLRPAMFYAHPTNGGYYREKNLAVNHKLLFLSKAEADDYQERRKNINNIKAEIQAGALESCSNDDLETIKCLLQIH